MRSYVEMLKRAGSFGPDLGDSWVTDPGKPSYQRLPPAPAWLANLSVPGQPENGGGASPYSEGFVDPHKANYLDLQGLGAVRSAIPDWLEKLKQAFLRPRNPPAVRPGQIPSGVLDPSSDPWRYQPQRHRQPEPVPASSGAGASESKPAVKSVAKPVAKPATAPAASPTPYGPIRLGAPLPERKGVPDRIRLESPLPERTGVPDRIRLGAPLPGSAQGMRPSRPAAKTQPSPQPSMLGPAGDSFLRGVRQDVSRYQRSLDRFRAQSEQPSGSFPHTPGYIPIRERWKMRAAGQELPQRYDTRAYWKPAGRRRPVRRRPYRFER